MNASLDISLRTMGFVSDEPGGSLHGTLGPVNIVLKNCDSRMKKRRCTLKTTSSTWKRNRQQGKGATVRRRTRNVTSASWKKKSGWRLAEDVLLVVGFAGISRIMCTIAVGDAYSDTVLKRPPQQDCFYVSLATAP